MTLLRFRRCLGLSAFWYACLHLAAWLSLDRQFDWARILEDLTKRPYVILGMTAFVLLIPLAATSSNAAIRRLGPIRWRALHRLAYPATLFAAIHFIWLVKAWPLEPLAYGAGSWPCWPGACEAGSRDGAPWGPDDGARTEADTGLQRICHGSCISLARLCGHP